MRRIEAVNGTEQKTRDNDRLHKRRGIWYYSLTVDGERRFFSTKTRKHTEARKVRAGAIKAQQENRLPTDLAKYPFDRLLAQVTDDRKPFLSENSIRIERERSVPLLAAFAGKRVCEIDHRAIRDYQAARLKNVSGRTINFECKLLRTVLKAAKIWRQIVDDYKSLPEGRKGPGRALDPDQEKLLLDTAREKPEWDAAFLAALVASNTTMRGVELKNLRLQDLDLIDQEIIIRTSKGRTAGERKIPLNSAALWGCARLLERANALGSIKPEHFLFPAFQYRRTKTTAARGTGYEPTRPQKTWRTAWRSLVKETAKRAGESAAKLASVNGKTPGAAEAESKKAATALKGLRFHDLRHCAITKLAESGATDQTIMSLAGHLDRKMLEHYSHIRNAAKRRAVDSISSYSPDPEASRRARFQ